MPDSSHRRSARTVGRGGDIRNVSNRLTVRRPDDATSRPLIHGGRDDSTNVSARSCHARSSRDDSRLSHARATRPTARRFATSGAPPTRPVRRFETPPCRRPGRETIRDPSARPRSLRRFEHPSQRRPDSTRDDSRRLAVVTRPPRRFEIPRHRRPRRLETIRDVCSEVHVHTCHRVRRTARMRISVVRCTRASDTMAAMTSKPELMQAATAAAIRYIDGERDSRVAPPRDVELPEDLDGDFLDVPWPADAVLQLLAEAGDIGATRTTGGRYFGFVTGGVEPIALAASTLAGAWDQNAGLPVMSPLAARLDEIAARWIVELLELPPESVAAFCAGATVANLTGIITGRDALLERVGWSTRERGLAGSPPITVVTGDEAHASALKALQLAGFGTRPDRARANRRMRAGSRRRMARHHRSDTGRAPSRQRQHRPQRPVRCHPPQPRPRSNVGARRRRVRTLGTGSRRDRRAHHQPASKPPTRGRPTPTSGSTRRMTAGS